MQKLNILILEDKKPTRIYYGCCDTAYGEIILFSAEKGIYGLHFLVHSPAYHIDLAQKKFPHTLFIPQPSVARQFWGRIVSARAPITIFLEGTIFQKNVWKALSHIPVGTTICYQKLAKQLGMGSQGARAVARVVAQNFIALLVPCHRVVRKNGHLGGYRWGLEKKRVLLKREQSLVLTK